MIDDARVPGQLLGHPLDRMTFATPADREEDMRSFWVWVAGFVATFAGGYEDVPVEYREETTEALAAN